MEWLWQFFYTLLPSKYPPMALSTLKTFLGGNSSDTLFFFLYLEIFGWEQFGYFVFFRYLEIFGWEQFGYFVFFLYLEIFGWEQFKKAPCIFCMVHFFREQDTSEAKASRHVKELLKAVLFLCNCHRTNRIQAPEDQ